MSVSSALCEFTMASTGSQWKFRTEKNMHFYMKYLRRGVNTPPLPINYVTCHVRQDTVAGRVIYHLSPRDIEPEKHIIFLHGGSYVNPITAVHWAFIQRLIRNTSCSVSVPIYGLIPESDYRHTYELLHEHYRGLLKDHAPEDIVLMGDSAGGGLALAFSQWLLGSELPQAGGVVMISPWLDVTLSNPAIEDVQKRDSILASPGNRAAGRYWAAELDPTDARVSPIYGPVDGLPPLCLLIGTHDILLPDARRLRGRAEKSGASLDYKEYPGMFHLWAFSPIPESRPAMEQMQAFIASA